jgi:large subunit ribosomal protein L22
MDKKIYKSQFKNIAQSPQKLRLVADVVRGKKVLVAFDLLKLLNKKGTNFVEKCLKSAVANASNIDGIGPEELVVSTITVDEAQTLGRVRFASRGRIGSISKRRSHLNIELSIK